VSSNEREGQRTLSLGMQLTFLNYENSTQFTTKTACSKKQDTACRSIHIRKNFNFHRNIFLLIYFNDNDLYDYRSKEIICRGVEYMFTEKGKIYYM